MQRQHISMQTCERLRWEQHYQYFTWNLETGEHRQVCFEYLFGCMLLNNNKYARFLARST
jgi:hypothetical protein